jgi:integrase
MASIEPRLNDDGSVTYRVRWRKGGKRSGKREGWPFDDLAAAENFRDAVDRADQEWPWGFVPIAGVGWDAQAYAALVSGQADIAEPALVETFAEFADKWVDRRTKTEPATRAGYRRDIARYMNPWFGSAAISDEDAIGEDALNDWIIDLLAGADERPKLAAATVRRLHGIMYALLKNAVRTKRRVTNPCEYTELPPASDGNAEDETAFLTRQEFHVLLACANTDVQDLLIVLVNTGLRWSEVSALQVQDVFDLLGRRPYLRVRRAWKRQPDNTFVLGPPKSRRSRRNVAVNRAIVEVLIGLVAGKRQTDFLFTTATNGVVWRHNQFFDTRWMPAVYRAIRCETHRAEDALTGVNHGSLRKTHLDPCGCPGTLERAVRIHDLRHSHASWLIADGAPITAIQRRLGHQSIQTTSDRYGHLMPEVEDAILDGLETGWRATLPAGIPGSPHYGPADYLFEVHRDYADAEEDYFEASRAWRDAGSPDASAGTTAAELRERVDEAFAAMAEAKAELDRYSKRGAPAVANAG